MIIVKDQTWFYRRGKLSHRQSAKLQDLDGVKYVFQDPGCVKIQKEKSAGWADLEPEIERILEKK